MSSFRNEITPLLAPSERNIGNNNNNGSPGSPRGPYLPLTSSRGQSTVQATGPTPVTVRPYPNSLNQPNLNDDDVDHDSKVQVYDVSILNPENSTPVIFHDDDPLTMLWKDFWVLVGCIPTVFFIFWPVPKPGIDATIKGLILQVFLVVVSLILTAVCLVSFFVGIPSPVVASLVLATWLYGYNFILGESRITYQNIPGDDKENKEVWLLVNGIGTSRSGLKLILDTLYTQFGRKVIGVHNRTFGVWFDLVECMLQRDLFWNTTDTREGYNIISRHVADPDKEKIVLMAHSQGGIIMSSWADQLLSDFSHEQLKKVEIYTFASAANHFSIPETGSGPAFSCVEHFVNEWDYVSDIGLLSFAPPPLGLPVNSPTVPRLSGRFAGRIFKRLATTGHLLITHYLPDNNSILHDPAVLRHSKLASYLNDYEDLKRKEELRIRRIQAEKAAREATRAAQQGAPIAGPSTRQ
ncbi:hypothetical protein I203_101926 [Kwoniella mangroviensis CBS 8507]|uniref:uncharacterized protein n=1 Tax=Kwoniella mangroviensis CBS 8507 TaxID=1296122 RepID=UPI00080D277E|nr:uncharacterized protein I203_03122 [Kwoniella mangroviensis CBS 8507]OCF67428.1 hypothetical protein I203_03122 [Kwoniella mangroviensis CBS 8507]